MAHDFFSNFRPVLRDLSEADLASEIGQPRRLLIESFTSGYRKLDIAYGPFDHVNKHAEIVVVGMTPGRQQMRNALVEARRCLKAGMDDEGTKAAAKIFASFSGPMRTNLVAMLDSVGVGKALGLSSTASLWSVDAHRAHFTSALRYPVFLAGQNYSGAPSMLSTLVLRKHLMRWFGSEMAALPNAVFVPLGPRVAEAVEAVARHHGLSTARILSGLPHPSGANAERIAFFLGRRKREHLSAKVDAGRLLACRAALETKIAMW